MNKTNPPTTESDSDTGAATSYAWEVIRLIPHPTDDKKHVRCSMLLSAQTIEQVWDYIAAERADASTEVEAISRIGPLVATLPPTTKGES